MILRLAILCLVASAAGCFETGRMLPGRTVQGMVIPRQALVPRYTVDGLAQLYALDLPAGYVCDAIWTSTSNRFYRASEDSTSGHHQLIIAFHDGAIAIADARKESAP